MNESCLPARGRNVALSVQDAKISYRVVKPVSISSLLKRERSAENRRFEAVRGVSFEVYDGEIVGIIGKNGSGKSTLLRAVANIYSPDTGTIRTFGHSVGLMSVGVGFSNELSGRDNIYLSGMLMGFKKNQIEEKIDDIIKFADIGDFIDAPVRSYSSGMHSKLAFSITAIMETDIMLVDEVLSVGDARFRKKSSKKMRQLIRDENKTVLIVSHSASVLRELCTRLIWLDGGRIRMIGDTGTVLEAYEDDSDREVE